MASLALLAHVRSCGEVVGANKMEVIKHSNAYDGSMWNWRQYSIAVSTFMPLRESSSGTSDRMYFSLLVGF